MKKLLVCLFSVLFACNVWAIDLADPGADRILYWDDDPAGSLQWLTPGSGLSISGTTMSVSGDITVDSITVEAVAAPHLLFKDSDGAGADKDAAWIKANMETTTDGSEDADLWFEVIQGGSENTEVLRFDESDDQWETTKAINSSGGFTGDLTGDVTGEASTVATIAGLAPDTATTQATQAGITTAVNLVSVGALTSGSLAAGFTDVPVAQGGTGASTLADGGLVIGNAASAVEVVAAGATTEILVGGGASTAPVWTTAQGTGAPVRAGTPTLTTPNIGAATGTSLDISGAAGLVLENDETITNTVDGTINFGAANLVATGTIAGAIGVTETTDGSETVSGSGAYGYLYEADHATATSDTTYTLPAAEVGMSACFYDNGAGAGGVILDPNSADNFILDGLAMANDENLNSPGVAGDGANGDFICIVAMDATTWVTLGRSGDWVEATPP